MLGNILAAAISIAAAFGFRVDVDHDTLQQAAGGMVAIVALLNAVLHSVRERNVDVQPRNSTAPAPGSTPVSGAVDPGSGGRD